MPPRQRTTAAPRARGRDCTRPSRQGRRDQSVATSPSRPVPRDPSVAASCAAPNSLATRFMPSRTGVASPTCAARSNPIGAPCRASRPYRCSTALRNAARSASAWKPTKVVRGQFADHLRTHHGLQRRFAPVVDRERGARVLEQQARMCPPVRSGGPRTPRRPAGARGQPRPGAPRRARPPSAAAAARTSRPVQPERPTRDRRERAAQPGREVRQQVEQRRIRPDRTGSRSGTLEPRAAPLHAGSDRQPRPPGTALPPPGNPEWEPDRAGVTNASRLRMRFGCK
jgi:hypothetical protein